MTLKPSLHPAIAQNYFLARTRDAKTVEMQGQER